ncbi:MAG: hypothetical protein ACR2KZ_08180, partial [Segetibacter sp.]
GKLYNKAGLSRALIFNVTTRIVQSAGGILALLLITHFLNKNEQGYFYTFTSLLSIQIFFELGLTNILTQYVAHEAAHLSWKNKHHISGNEYYESRLSSLLHSAVQLFLVLSVTLFIVLFLCGRIFFSSYNNDLNIDWQVPWLVLSISTAFLLIFNLFLAILEGLGKIEEINKLKLIQQSINIFLVAFFLFAGLKLLSAGLALLISIVITGFILFTNYRRIFINIWQTQIKWRVDFRKEVLPFLFKIALGNISGYFIYQIINPVLFATQGPAIAGQMGATLTFLNGILVVSSSWLSTKVALFSNFVSLRKFRNLNLVYRKNFIISFFVCSAGIISFVAVIALLQQFYPQVGNRFLGILPVIFLGLTQITSVVGNSQAYYLRSFKKEPFFIPSIVIGIVSGISTVICCKYFGITAMTFSYFIINGIIGFLWGCAIFRSKAFEWTNTRLSI